MPSSWKWTRLRQLVYHYISPGLAQAYPQLHHQGEILKKHMHTAAHNMDELCQSGNDA